MKKINAYFKHLQLVCTRIGAGRACMLHPRKGEYKAKLFPMPAASAIRLQIESALAARIPAALTPTARIVRPVAPTGIDALDEVLHGGLPVGALTELVGPECSGRTSVALKFVAGMTQAGKSVRVDRRVECARSGFGRGGWRGSGAVVVGAVRGSETRERRRRPQRFSLPEKYLTPAPVMKGLHGGGLRRSPARRGQGIGRSRKRTAAAGDAKSRSALRRAAAAGTALAGKSLRQIIPRFAASAYQRWRADRRGSAAVGATRPGAARDRSRAAGGRVQCGCAGPGRPDA